MLSTLDSIMNIRFDGNSVNQAEQYSLNAVIYHSYSYQAYTVRNFCVFLKRSPPANRASRQPGVRFYITIFTSKSAR